MKKTVLAGLAVTTLVANQAYAADLRVKALPAPPAFYTWTGSYIGGHVGWGWQHEDPFVVACNCGAAGGMAGMGSPGTYTANGFLGGVQAGYNWQFGGPWVLGIEGEFAWTDMKGEADWSVNGEPHTLSTRVKWIGDVAGRLGYAFDRTLLYVKGGWAWQRADYEHTHLMAGPVLHDLTGSIDRNGWLVGLGVEHAFWRNTTLKVEWNYIGLGSDNVTTASGPMSATFNVDSHINIIKAGINYRF